MKLYGLQHGLYGIQHGIGGIGRIGGLNPKKKDKGPPIPGYFAWYQANTRRGLVYDSTSPNGADLIGLRGEGPGAADLNFSGARAAYGEPGLTFPSATSKLRGGSFDDTRTAFVVFGAASWREYAGILANSSGAGTEYVFLNMNNANAGNLQTGWGFEPVRMNGLQGSSMMPYDLDGTMNVASTVRLGAGSLGGVIQVGNDRSNSGRNWPGAIGEVLLYERVLNEGERGMTERWLAARWGILSKFL